MIAPGPGLAESVEQALSQLHVSPGTKNHIIFCDVLHIFAFVLLTAALLTATISRRVPRTTPWFLLLSSATLGAGSRILIVGQQTSPDINPSICTMQAMLLNGSALLNIYASAAFLLQFYLTLLAVQNSRELPTITFVLMQVIPIFVFLGAVLATLVVATSKPYLIRRTLTGMYCEIESSALNISLTAVGLVGVLATVSTKVILLINLIRRRKSLHSPGLPAILRHPSVIPRAFGYTFILFLIFVLGVASFFLKDVKMLSPMTDIVISVGSAVTAVVFATESDILKVWFFWRNPKETNAKEGVPTASV